MQLISVNVGQEQAIQNAKESGKTGIYKLPSEAPVQITGNGLVGDFIADTKNHGGVDQAVYIYGTIDYAWWAQTLDKPLLPGTFGENLTITDLESARISVGDRLRLGGVLLEVTAPRLPCSTLAARMGDRDFVKRFRDAGRPGVYCRVIQEGWVQAGMPVLYEAYTGETITLLEMFQSAYETLSAETLQRQLKAPMAIRARVDKEEQLKKLSKL